MSGAVPASGEPVLSRLRRWHVLGPAGLSRRTLAWFAPIGVLAVVLTVPGGGSTGVLHWQWWLTALLAQVAFTGVVVVLRAHAMSVVAVGLVLVAAGATRGLVVGAMSAALGLDDGLPLAERVLNSSVIGVLWCALIGGIVEWSGSYAQQYRLLVERAVAVERPDGDVDIDPATLAAWSQVRASVDDIVRGARADLSSARDSEGLQEVAVSILRAIDLDVRPASHRLWLALDDEPPALRWQSLLHAALDPWRPPVGSVMAFFGAIVSVGAVLHLGLVGLGYAVCVVTMMWLVLALSSRVARTSAHQVAVAVVALVVLTLAVFGVSMMFGTLVPALSSDVVNGLVVAVMAPGITVAVAVPVRLAAHRQAVLDSLRARIDKATVSRLARAAQHRADAARLGAYVHHSVQSELAALALQLSEAAQTGDPLIVEAVRERVLDRLARMASADDDAPPWLRSTSGIERIADVAAAWDGIVDVVLDLDDETAARADQWDLAAQLVAEGIANAVRHGQASAVRVHAHRVDDGTLVVSIDDDGASSATVNAPGLGSAWLDHVALDAWTREATPAGTRLVVRLA